MELPLPPVYLLSTRLGADEQHDLEERIPTLTYDINEADIVLTDISKPQRVRFDMRRRGLTTEPLVSNDETGSVPEGPARKRRRLTRACVDGSEAGGPNRGEKVVRAVKIEWFTESMEQGEVLPLKEYIVYEGRVAEHAKVVDARPQTPKPAVRAPNDILARALADGGSPSRQSQRHSASPGSRFDGRRSSERLTTVAYPPAIPHETTSEHEAPPETTEIPPFLETAYSCQRPTPNHPPNAEFIELLKQIRKTRTLLGDSVGVRAYSTAIATLSACPFILISAADLERLPGCSSKITRLFEEWKRTGTAGEIEMTRSDPKLSVIALFYDIWGVGDTTARGFYRKGWRDLDDVVEYGWQTLSRVQQIGVKYYDEFLRLIPRDEVEHVGNTILQHARRIDQGFQLTIVGGYRRGKEGSGDVDVVVSHPDEQLTSGFITKLVVSLERTGHITHTLTLSLHNSERGQEPVSWKGNTSGGTGFDTLDKALVVWQEPETAELEDGDGGDDDDDDGDKSDESQPAGGKWPHRRVDIIISPWKTVGCAVLGWSGGTTFQRDLRRYCKKVKGLKFDSSGIRSRADGKWVDLEGGAEGPATDMVTAERRVFAGLGLEWRPPEERCTG